MSELGCNTAQVDDPGCPRCRGGAHNNISLMKVGKGIPGGCPRSDYGKRRWVADADLAGAALEGLAILASAASRYGRHRAPGQYAVFPGAAALPRNTSCPQGHRMDWIFSDAAYECDGCGADIEPGADLRECGRCDFSICRECLVPP